MLQSVSDIRAEFIKYFVGKGHVQALSSSLVPNNDPTLMFTNAGMVQFKDVFTGKKTLEFKRATTAQKCLRAGGKHNDLENVGYTARHHTFFEMLGNFSFGDYFKEDAIKFAWEVVTEIFGLPKDKLLVTVHSSDEDAALLWRKISGFDDSRIIRISTNDNFWSMGETGPCGPCAEIFYDHGKEIPGGPPGSENGDGDRFIEIWNLVFMQFEKQNDGSQINLPKPSIDTGMGLERIAAVLQGVHSNYEIDLFKNLIADIESITGKEAPSFATHKNVIADHIRAISFMIADGIVPSNEGRGYVLRRIIRRALRHGYMMSLREPFLYRLVSSVGRLMGEYYTELVSNEDAIKQVVKSEEENFMKTIDSGMHILKNEINRLGSSTIFPADVAYKLYDTYGFPFDLTQDILRSERKKVNEKEFDKIAAKQKEASKKAWTGTGDSFTAKAWFDIAKEAGPTEFARDVYSLESKIVAIVKEDEKIDKAVAGEEVFIVVLKTPFYAESGGQIGDRGWIGETEVVDVKNIEGLVVHKCFVKSELKVGDNVTLNVDSKKRLACSKNHTATHMLQAALRQVLGGHVVQKGSLVTDERLRFDFIHNGSIEKAQVEEVESIVLDAIDRSLDVTTEIMSVEDAKASGAVALFGEKYQSKVRVVSIGDGFSKELCGGTHVSNTSQIGAFKIISVSSIGSGIKRIEAATGRALIDHFEKEVLKRVEKIDSQTSLIKNLEKQVSELKMQSVSENVRIDSKTIGSSIFKHAVVQNLEHKAVLGIIDRQKNAAEEICFVIGNESSKSGKVSACIFVSKKLLSKFDVNELLKKLNDSLGITIKTGGRSELIQFGGIDAIQFKKCLEGIGEFLEKIK
ncbi:MAG: alanine--tRNA ligase [Holosporales bacterium]|jgi:alanyl-tRNA synthetase|nr:alanine--tRNA ligase [Holosporales bacterium]